MKTTTIAEQYSRYNNAIDMLIELGETFTSKQYEEMRNEKLIELGAHTEKNWFGAEILVIPDGIAVACLSTLIDHQIVETYYQESYEVAVKDFSGNEKTIVGKRNHYRINPEKLNAFVIEYRRRWGLTTERVQKEIESLRSQITQLEKLLSQM